jgi:hypothetical protein
MKNNKSQGPDFQSQQQQFSPSALFYGGRMMGRTYQDPKYGFVAKYNPSKAERRQQALTQSRINALLPTLGQTAPQVGQRFDRMRDDYIGQQTDMFSKEYKKTLDGLREDIGSRFGTLKNSTYFDKLGRLQEDVYNPAILDIQRTGSLMRRDLDSQEQQRKMQELGALMGVFGQGQSNYMNQLNMPLQGSQLLNQWNLNQMQQQAQQKQNATNSFLGFLGGMM